MSGHFLLLLKILPALRETQGSLSPEDISRFESGSAFTRMFTQFSGYFNMQANLLGSEFAKTMQEMGLKPGAGRLFYVFLFGFLVPAWFSEAIVQAMRGGPDDDNHNGYLDEFLAFFFGAPLRNAAALVPLVPLVGQTSMAAVNSFNSKPYDDRISTAPAVSMIENAAQAPHSIYKAIVDDGKASRAIRDTLTLVSMATGIPVAALGKPPREAYVVVISEVPDLNEDGAIDLTDVEHLLRNDANAMTRWRVVAISEAPTAWRCLPKPTSWSPTHPGASSAISFR